jgi:hypothetical protein
MTRTTRPPAKGRTRPIPRWRAIGPLIVVLVAITGLVAACSGGRSQDAASSSHGNSAQSSAMQSGILFASCIRAHGVPNFPDSDASAAGQLHLHVPGYLKSEPQFQSALQACQRDLPGGGPVKHVNVREELNFAICMRAHGIADFPDPEPRGGFEMIPGNTDSPQFEAAARACESSGVHWNSAP